MEKTKRQWARYRFLSLMALLIPFLLAFWVLNASKVGPLQGCLQGCATTTGENERTLRVISMNVLHGFPGFKHLRERMEIIAGEIQHLDADVVLLQEVPWTWRTGNVAKLLADLTGLNYVYLPANGNRWAILFSEGEAILSKYALQEVTYVELTPKAGFFEHRVALQATAETPWGELRLVSTHLTNGEVKINREQAASLEAFLGKDRERAAIMAGDFNAEEDSPQIKALSNHWVDTFRSLHPNDDGNTCCIDDLQGPPGEPLEERIDYIFLVSGGLNPKVLESKRILDQPVTSADGWQWASDHLGLFVILELEP